VKKGKGDRACPPMPQRRTVALLDIGRGAWF
jgi:hypothetical protein